MRKDLPPPHNRHLQLVSDDGAPRLPQAGAAWGGSGGPAPFLRQIAAEGQRNVLGGWRAAVVVLVALVVVYGGLHLGAAHLRSPSGTSFDARRFSMTASVRAKLSPQDLVTLHDEAQVRADDAWSFVVHNRSHQNAFFGLFAVSAQGQFFWFYPRDGGGVDLQTLPLPAIPTITLPDGVTPEALPDGKLDVVAVFLPQAALLSQLEATYQSAGAAGLRRQWSADVQTLHVLVSGP